MAGCLLLEERERSATGQFRPGAEMALAIVVGWPFGGESDCSAIELKCGAEMMALATVAYPPARRKRTIDGRTDLT